MLAQHNIVLDFFGFGKNCFSKFQFVGSSRSLSGVAIGFTEIIISTSNSNSISMSIFECGIRISRVMISNSISNSNMRLMRVRCVDRCMTFQLCWLGSWCNVYLLESNSVRFEINSWIVNLSHRIANMDQRMFTVYVCTIHQQSYISRDWISAVAMHAKNIGKSFFPPMGCRYTHRRENHKKCWTFTNG